jgi:hypothetical protein
MRRMDCKNEKEQVWAFAGWNAGHHLRANIWALCVPHLRSSRSVYTHRLSGFGQPPKNGFCRYDRLGARPFVQ